MMDLTAVLFAQRSIPRPDQALTHVADLTSCLRATAYRRRGMQPEPFTARDLAKFAIGHGYEYEVAKTLREAGYDAVEDEEAQGFGLDIGHPDIIVFPDVDADMPNLVIECKTTDGGANYPKSDRERAGQPKEVSVHHAIQAAAYALMVGAPKAVVLVKHAGIGDRGHEEVAHVVEPEAYREQIEALAREVVALTGPEMPLPPAEPKPREVVPYDECGYCHWRQCERNPNHQEEVPL